RQQDSDRGRGPGWALRRRQAQAKERTTSRNQLAQLASSCRLQIELVTVRHPAIAALPLVDIADPGKWHVETGHKNPVGGEHVQDALAGRDGLFFVVVHLEVPFRTLDCHYKLRARVRRNHHAFSCAFDMKCQQAGRMACRINSGNAWDNLIAGLDELRTIGQRHANLYEELSIKLAGLSYVFAGLPEIELGCTEHIGGVGKNRLPLFHQTTNVVGMPMRKDDDVDVLRLVSSGS